MKKDERLEAAVHSHGNDVNAHALEEARKRELAEYGAFTARMDAAQRRAAADFRALRAGRVNIDAGADAGRVKAAGALAAAHYGEGGSESDGGASDKRYSTAVAASAVKTDGETTGEGVRGRVRSLLAAAEAATEAPHPHAHVVAVRIRPAPGGVPETPRQAAARVLEALELLKAKREQEARRAEAAAAEAAGPSPCDNDDDDCQGAWRMGSTWHVCDGCPNLKISDEERAIREAYEAEALADMEAAERASAPRSGGLATDGRAWFRIGRVELDDDAPPPDVGDDDDGPGPTPDEWAAAERELLEELDDAARLAALRAPWARVARMAGATEARAEAAAENAAYFFGTSDLGYAHACDGKVEAYDGVVADLRQLARELHAAAKVGGAS